MIQIEVVTVHHRQKRYNSRGNCHVFLDFTGRVTVSLQAGGASATGHTVSSLSCRTQRDAKNLSDQAPRGSDPKNGEEQEPHGILEIWDTLLAHNTTRVEAR